MSDNLPSRTGAVMDMGHPLSHRLSHIISALDPAALDALAGVFDILGETCRDRAGELRAIEECRSSAEHTVSGIAASPLEVVAAVCSGAALEQAFSQVAASLGVPVESVRQAWGRDAAENRALVVLRLVRLGMSNRAIADRLGIHPVSVSRIVGRKLGRGGRAAASDHRERGLASTSDLVKGPKADRTHAHPRAA